MGWQSFVEDWENSFFLFVVKLYIALYVQVNVLYMLDDYTKFYTYRTNTDTQAAQILTSSF